MKLQVLSYLSLLLLSVKPLCAVEGISTAKSTVLLEENVSKDPFISSIKEYPAIGVTEWILENGMRICLKPTDFDEDEVVIRISAPGGYAIVSPSEKASAKLSAQVVLESGLGNMSCDQLSVDLYEHSIDFSISIDALSRSIEGNSTPQTLEEFLKLTHLTFTKPLFCQKAFDAVVSQMKECIKKRSLDFDTTFEENYLITNTQNLSALNSLTIQDVEKADFSTSKKFFDYAFSNPSDFVCVIVGNFDIEKIKPLVKRYLSSIPARTLNIGTVNPTPHSFPSGVTTKVIPTQKPGDGTARLTFPILVKLDETKIHSLELACQVVEARLRKAIHAYLKASQGVDVAYEFPLYPSLDLAWISIQFRSDPKFVKNISEIILDQLRQLQTAGPTFEEIEEAKTQQKQSDDYWLRENDFWIATLSNYYLVGWNPENIIKDLDQDQNLKAERIKDVIKTYFSISNYSFISSTPS